MKTRKQVEKKALESGCQLEVSSLEVALKAPQGKLLGGELHWSVFDLEVYSKAQIWETLWAEMNWLTDCPGSDYCDC